MQDSEIHEVAEALRKARINRAPIHPPSKTWSALDVDGAFKVAETSVDIAVKQHGDRLVGYKLGNIAKVTQDAFGLDKPDYGFLLASSFVYVGTQLKLDQYIKPYVELEPAFIPKSSLKGPNVTVAELSARLTTLSQQSKSSTLVSRIGLSVYPIRWPTTVPRALSSLAEPRAGSLT
jgi:2-keto-4-pentenoate hydratase